MEIVKMPRLGLNETESMIGTWFVSEGDAVSVGDELFSIETDKSSMSVYSEFEGVVLKVFYKECDTVPVMTPACIIGSVGEDVSSVILTESEFAGDIVDRGEKVEKRDLQKGSIATKDEAPISPRAKKLAGANGIDISGIMPSGAEGRIIEADVIEEMRLLPKHKEAKLNVLHNESGERQAVKFDKIRKVIAKNMMDSLQNTAQLTSNMKFNASKIQKYRAWYKSSPGEEKNITITDMVLFAVAKTLPEFEYMNAHMVSDEEMVLFSNVNLGCAVDTEKGLMVPTIRNANKISLLKLSKDMKRLAEKCKNGSIALDEMTGGTFTVSNLGGLGVSSFTPILNPPQVGILGVGEIDLAIKRTEEGILHYPAGHLSLTYDHRAVDGAPAARFLKAVCDNLENFECLV